MKDLKLPRKEFIPAWLDDSDLSSQEFRLYCHISRRGTCYESIPAIARACRLHSSTVKRGLKELHRRGLVQKESRIGSTTVFRIVAQSEPSLKGDLGLESTQVVSIPRCNGAPPPRARNRPGVGGLEPYEGSLNKVAPFKEKKSSNSSRGTSGRKTERGTKLIDEAKEVLAYLNERAGRKFTESDSHLCHIQKRLDQKGVTAHGLKELIDSKVAEWKGNEEMERHLCSETLFGRKRFQRYYDDRHIAYTASNSKQPKQAKPLNGKEWTVADCL